MKYLESIKLIQFFLFEKQEIRLNEITGIFGPNGSGKSSIIDAVQIAMYGANARLLNLNSQADEKQASTRSIRAYCLGVTDDVKRARDNATTYITLVWRDSITKEATSTGVCIYASMDSEAHEVRGRYILPGIELSMNDHVEVVGNQERPRTWETFRHNLLERAKAFGEDPIYPDSERFISATLLALRGSGGAPSLEAFKSAFRFALKMRFDKSVDLIVRNDVLESRPTNINKFKEVTESFRNLAKKVAEVKAKIEDGERVETEFDKADAASKRSITWGGLQALAESKEISDSLDVASDEHNDAVQNLANLNDQHANESAALQTAQEAAKANRNLIMNHAAHQENGMISSEIIKSKELESKKSNDIRNSLNLIRNALETAAKSKFVENNSSLMTVVKTIDAAIPRYQEMSREDLTALIKPSVKKSTRTITELFDTSRGINSEKTLTEEQLKLNESALLRVKSGRSRLSHETDRLLAELNDNGIHATPVCDLVNITDPNWQPVIEAYLGRNIEALLVNKGDEEKAFSIYRGLTGPRAIYGAKIVAASKQSPVEALSGSVAEMIVGDNPHAVAYLRKRFGDMMRAVTDAEALGGKRTLTQDGMIIQSGEYDRIKPVMLANLKIGGGDVAQKEALAQEIAQLKADIRALAAKAEGINTLVETLRRISSEESVMKYMLDACDEMHTARNAAASLTLRLNDTADAEYVRLNKIVAELESKASNLMPQVSDLKGKVGRAEEKVTQCEGLVATEQAKLDLAQKKVIEIESDVAYDRDFASKQWNILLEKHDEQFTVMKEHCAQQANLSRNETAGAFGRGFRELGTFREKYREQGVAGGDDWGKERKWIGDLLKRLRETELSEFDAKMKEAYKASQDTFRADVAIALSNNIDHLEKSMNRLNQVLSTCPVFSNGERYRFTRTIRPQLKSLLKFVKDIAAFGPVDDLLGGAGEMPEEFRQLLDDKIAPAAGAKNPLDDYREFFEFDIEILREDAINKTLTSVGSLSKRLGNGSGGEHRAPLYVIAGAALASAYRLDSGNRDGIRLMLLDEAFNKMDTSNIVATMRYLEQLGLQVFMASPGDNLGTLNAFLHRYYDILRDVEYGAMLITGHDVSEIDRDMFKSDLAEFNGELIENELAAIRQERVEAVA